MSALNDLEVWFVTGSQELYGEQTLRQVADQSRAIAATLAGAGAVTRPEDIRRTMLAASRDDAVIGVIAWMHTFSPAKMWISGLNALSKPLLHLHTQAN